MTNRAPVVFVRILDHRLTNMFVIMLKIVLDVTLIQLLYGFDKKKIFQDLTWLNSFVRLTYIIIVIHSLCTMDA
jgi:hypothetical protein